VGKTRAVGLQALYRGARHADSTKSRSLGFGCGTCVEAESGLVLVMRKKGALTCRPDASVGEGSGPDWQPSREEEGVRLLLG
jgi:hypothetical protein